MEILAQLPLTTCSTHRALSPPCSAPFHFTVESNFAAISSSLVFGSKCGLTGVPWDNRGFLVSLSPLTKPTGQPFTLRLGLDCSFDIRMYQIVKTVKSSLRKRLGEPGLIISFPAEGQTAKNVYLCSNISSVPFIWGA